MLEPAMYRAAFSYATSHPYPVIPQDRPNAGNEIQELFELVQSHGRQSTTIEIVE